MDDDNVLKEHEQSEFNAGIATLQRLHELKKWLISCTLIYDPISHYRHLKAFYKELEPMFTEEKKVQKGRWKTGKLLEQKLLKKVALTQEQMDFLDDWEMELREIEQKAGLNMPKKKDARFALSRR